MSSKRNQTIAIARFLMYKYGLNQQLEGMTDEEYLAHPIGLDVGQYVADLMKYCPEHIVDQVMEHQDALLRRLGTDYLTVIAYMPYEEDGGRKYADHHETQRQICSQVLILCISPCRFSIAQKNIWQESHLTPYLCKWYNDGEKYHHNFNIKSPYKEVFK